jgi:hypothetical protein
MNNAQEDTLLAKFPPTKNIFLNAPLVLVDSRIQVILWYIPDGLSESLDLGESFAICASKSLNSLIAEWYVYHHLVHGRSSEEKHDSPERKQLEDPWVQPASCQITRIDSQVNQHSPMLISAQSRSASYVPEVVTMRP